MKNLLLLLIIYSTLFSAISFTQDFWEKRELENFGDGYISSIVFNSYNHIFVSTMGSLGCSIIRSTNDGDNWKEINNGLNNYIRALIVNARNDLFCSEGYNIFRSTNNGETWMQCGNLGEVYSLACNKDNHIFVLTRLEAYRSTNDGKNWTRLFYNNSNIPMSVLEVNSKGYIFMGSLGNGLYRSTDNGNTWIKKDNGLNSYIKTISIDSSDNIFVGTNRGVFRSFDNGENWSNPSTNTSEITTITCGKNNYIYAGTFGEGILRSTDFGENWIKINKGLTTSIWFNIQKLKVDKNNRIYAGIEGCNLFSSIDNGETWNPVPAINSFSVRTVGSLEYSNNLIFAGTDNGIFSSTGGTYWMEKNNGINLGGISALVMENNNSLFAGAWKVYHTTDNGENWSEVSNGLPFQSISSLSINANGYLFAGIPHYGFYRSVDKGENWAKIDKGIPLNFISDYGILKIHAFKSNSNIFATIANLLYKSISNGENWIQVNLNMANDEINTIIQKDKREMFAGTSNGKIWYSSDEGENWSSTGNGINAQIYVLTINKSDQIFAGTSNGVFCSKDNGNNWEEIKTGLLNKSIISLMVDSVGYIYAGTVQSGVLRSVNTTTSIKNTNKVLKYFTLSQNYPNPFNPTTKIKYSIPYSSFVTLKVYDLLGREIATLVNEEKPVGNYEVEFDGTGLASGIYLYKIQAGDFINTKKLLFLK